MRTKDKMIRIAGRNVFCSTIPQNATDKLVLIFFMIRLFWKLEKFPTQLCDKMETAGFLYDRLGHGNQTLWIPNGQRLPWSGSRFSKKL
jgi:hypothetical protein